MTATLKKLWKNEYFQTIVIVCTIAAVVFGFWFGSQAALGTKIPPALAVVSGSMCIPYDGACDGWDHPFDRTLHVGDIIVIQGVNPRELNANYPNSDIIVFHRPGLPDELIVHRIVKTEEINGKLYFYTKGDGNSPPDTWPTIPQPYEYDQWYTGNMGVPQGAVSEDLVVGKVIMRIPWLGHIAIFMHDTLGVNNSYVGVAVVAILIVILIIIEFLIPLIKRKEPQAEQKSSGSELHA
ncbi:MAG: hypothetical protein ACE14S_08700 [Candidatus Bathyarchaeia archaeon]